MHLLILDTFTGGREKAGNYGGKGKIGQIQSLILGKPALRYIEYFLSIYEVSSLLREVKYTILMSIGIFIEILSLLRISG